jgi:hypothetical protein
MVYDNRLEDYGVLGLSITTALNKGGAATIILPPGHPAYNSFISYKTIVEIYRDAALLFRGRVLYPEDDFYNRRTITCEGERCFLRDCVIEPYVYRADPRVIFSDLIARYNARMDPFKQFKLGKITARDPNDYQHIESGEASQVSDVIDKLVEYVGGYITFTSDAAGNREINWLADVGRECGQRVEFGENLLDFSRTGANTELATVIYPYGAKNETTGERVTIESVNNGLPYVQDDAAVALRGRIERPVYWDDVTRADNLLTKAKQYLANSKMSVTTLELSAIDLSAVDKSIDAFRVGDNIRVVSAPHGIDDTFLLRERSYDLLDPSQDSIVLGQSLVTLTGADVASSKNALAQLRRTEQSLKTDYKIQLTDAVNTLRR